MNLKKIMLGLGLLSALGLASAALAKEDADMKNNATLMVEITPEDVNAVKLTDVDGGLEMKGFSIDKKEIKPEMVHFALEKLKDSVEPGETVMLGVGVLADGKAEACKLRLTMGEKHEISKAEVEGCETFKGAKLESKGKKVVIILKKEADKM